MTTSHEQNLAQLQQNIWHGSLPLEIRLASSECRTFDQSDPYMIYVPRVSYLPFLLPRLHAFFKAHLIDPDASAPHQGWFSYESVPLKWHYPVGLLHDLYSGAEPATAHDQHLASTLQALRSGTSKAREQAEDGVELEAEGGGVEVGVDAAGEGSNASSEIGEAPLPWRLVVRFADWPADQLVRLDKDGKQMLDAFRNGVKEAGFVRHGTGKVVMSLSYEDSRQMWRAVEENRLDLYAPVQTKLLSPPGLSTKSLPIRLYLPTASAAAPSRPLSEAPAAAASPALGNISEDAPTAAASLRVIQSPIAPFAAGGGSMKQPQTLGMALNALLPALFPSRRSPLLALAVLHGAVVPMGANLEELVRAAAYADGWLHIAVRMMA